MKARLNVLGNKLEVVSISYRNDEVDSVMIVDDKGILHTYHSEEGIRYTEPVLRINLKEALEFPEIEQRIAEERAKLIEHLEELVLDEDNTLTGIAIDAMECEEGSPFDAHLSAKQKEYKLMQQRVLGVFDTVEEVKAFTEGFFDRAERITEEVFEVES